MGTFHVIILLIVLQVAWRQKCARLVQNGTIFSGGNFSMGSEKGSARYHFRVSEANDAHIRAQARNPQFRTASNYLKLGRSDRTRRAGTRGCGRWKRKSRQPSIRCARIKGRLTRRRRRGCVFFHACVKMWLANQPEADGIQKQLAVSQAERRYQKLLTNAAQLMSEPHD